MTRAEILEKARRCVCGHRENEYGTPENSFDKIAKLWTAYKGVDFSSVDVSMMMALLKIARIAGDKATDDSFIDLAGYAACGGEISSKTNPVIFGAAFIECDDGMSVYNPLFSRFVNARKAADELSQYAKEVKGDVVYLNDFYRLINEQNLLDSRERQFISHYFWRADEISKTLEVVSLGGPGEYMIRLPKLHCMDRNEENNNELDN